MRVARLMLSLLMTCLATSCGWDATSPALMADLDDAKPAQAQDAIYAGGRDLYEGNGRLVALHGFNYFGFNNGQTMLDGFWGGPGLVNDFATVVHRQKLLGFNAVRLPFSFSDLQGLKPKPFTQTCVMPTDAEIARSVTPPGKTAPASIKPLPYPPHRVAGQCNGYLPNTTTWDRFKWVVSFYARNGFYVLIDNHLREDRTALDNPVHWAKSWAKLVAELRADPAVKAKLMVDLLNEPDQYGLRWEAQSGLPGLADLYLQGMDAIEAAAPGTLYFIEGTGQLAINTNWGDGYATNNDIIARKGLSNPRPFFARLMRKRYARHVILAPHVYGPAVTTNAADSAGQSLVNRLTTSFGSLTKSGFCADSTGAGSICQTFPVAIGEFGSKLEDPRDLAWLKTFQAYLLNEGEGNDNKHAPIRNWFWWSWNANSGDTGGLVGDDWMSIQWAKINALNKIGLKGQI